jgi:hypothetical protein
VHFNREVKCFPAGQGLVGKSHRESRKGSLLLFVLQVPPKDKRRREPPPLRGPRRAGPSPRAAALEPFVAEQCVATATAVAKLLDDRLSSLPVPKAEDAPVVEQALLVGMPPGFNAPRVS